MRRLTRCQLEHGHSARMCDRSGLRMGQLRICDLQIVHKMHKSENTTVGEDGTDPVGRKGTAFIPITPLSSAQRVEEIPQLLGGELVEARLDILGGPLEENPAADAMLDPRHEVDAPAKCTDLVVPRELQQHIPALFPPLQLAQLPCLNLTQGRIEAFALTGLAGHGRYVNATRRLPLSPPASWVSDPGRT